MIEINIYDNMEMLKDMPYGSLINYGGRILLKTDQTVDEDIIMIDLQSGQTCNFYGESSFRRVTDSDYELTFAEKQKLKEIVIPGTIVRFSHHGGVFIYTGTEYLKADNGTSAGTFFNVDTGIRSDPKDMLCKEGYDPDAGLDTYDMELSVAM